MPEPTGWWPRNSLTTRPIGSYKEAFAALPSPGHACRLRSTDEASSPHVSVLQNQQVVIVGVGKVHAFSSRKSHVDAEAFRRQRSLHKPREFFFIFYEE